MLKESGVVSMVEGDQARVVLVRSEACGDCPAKSSCHVTSEGNMEMEVTNSAGARVGDRVDIELRPASLLRATTLAYLFPATAMLAGGAAGWIAAGTDLGAMIGAAGGLAFASAVLYLHGRRKNARHVPVITGVVKRGS